MFDFITATGVDNLARSDTLRASVVTSGNRYIAADSLPPELGVPADHFAFRMAVQHYVEKIGIDPAWPDEFTAGYNMAQDIFFVLYGGSGYHLYQGLPGVIPARVILDELKTSDVPAGTYARFANVLAWCGYSWFYFILPTYPEYAGRWAVAAQHCQNVPPAPQSPYAGSYADASVDNAIYWILYGGGQLAFEMYPHRTDYCPSTNRDVWLKAFFQAAPDGSGTGYGFQFVYDRYPAFHDKMSVIFGVYDSQVWNNGVDDDDLGARNYLDRMFYIWKRYLPADVIDINHGGPGSHKWKFTVAQGETADTKVNSASRDWQFVDVWNYYVRDSQPGPRFTVPC
jgi:hypothetical protein